MSLAVACSVVFGLLALTTVGLIPDPRNSEIRRRSLIAEDLAVAGHTMMSQKASGGSAAQALRSLAARHPDVLSVRIVRAGGEVLFDYRDPDVQHASSAASTIGPNTVTVPLLRDNKLWGETLVDFAPVREAATLSILGIQLPAFVPLAGCCMFALCFLYLSWIFRHQDQGADEIPEHVRQTLDTLVEGVLLLNKNDKIALANASFAKSIGRSVDDLEGQEIDGFVSTDEIDSESAEELPWERSMREQEVRFGDLIFVQTAEGDTRKFSVNSTSIQDPDGECRGALATFDDLTAVEKRNMHLESLLQRLKKSRKQIARQNKELQNLATYDSLTECLNRRAFSEELDQLWTDALRYEDDLGCLMIDIDHFKSVNDGHGHQMGDRVLKRVAKIFQSMTRNEDLLCRFGGEEFCVILPQVEAEEAAHAAERLRSAIDRDPIHGLRVTISIGVSALSFGPSQPDDLLRAADEALYAAKGSGRNRVVVWSESCTELPAQPSTDRASGVARDVIHDSKIPFCAVTSLVSALAHRDVATAEHSRRVADLCLAVAADLMTHRESYVLEVAALLHDIGKLGVPDSILFKPGPLNTREWEVMRTHDEIGVDIIESALHSQELQAIVANHHAWYGGNPHNPELPTGDEIPLGARILCIADAYDAMVTERVYRKQRRPDEAFAELRRCASLQFDPQLVEQFIATVKQSDQTDDQYFENISKQTALEIGAQIEKLGSALDDQDLPDLACMAARIKSTAVDHDIRNLGDVAARLERAATDGESLIKVAELTGQLLDLCRRTQMAYLENARKEPRFQIDAEDLVDQLSPSEAVQ